MKKRTKLIAILLLTMLLACTYRHKKDVGIKGWNILSSDINSDYQVINAAKEYNINHLQLSHQLIHNLKDVRDTERREKTNLLINKAHKAGIKEVFVWDHTFYKLDYYPKKFLVDSVTDKRINLDDPSFWQWYKNDYRQMFKLMPDVDGTVLTFVETGATIENQYSQKLDKYQKMACVIDSLASLVVNELGKKMYIRTFEHTSRDLDVILGCMRYVKNKEIIVMVKEVPFDFFNLNPVQNYLEIIKFPVVIEFDAAHEYNGQGIVANTFTNLILKRWKFYLKKNNVIGYVARVDRFGTTKIINHPSEILLSALNKTIEDTTVTEDDVCDDFITKKYGKNSIPFVKPAFKSAIDINLSSFYTLALNSTNHSRLDIDYESIYDRYITGRWYDPPLLFVKNDINKEFHHFADVLEHLSPARYKQSGGRFEKEEPIVFFNKWFSPVEKMNREYLGYILKEKDYSVREAEKALQSIERGKHTIRDSNAYHDLHETFNRTIITCKMRRAAHKAYFGYRVYIQDTLIYKDELPKLIMEGVEELRECIGLIEKYPYEIPVGEWNWRETGKGRRSDIEQARKYIQNITETGWQPYSSVVIRTPKN